MQQICTNLELNTPIYKQGSVHPKMTNTLCSSLPAELFRHHDCFGASCWVLETSAALLNIMEVERFWLVVLKMKMQPRTPLMFPFCTVTSTSSCTAPPACVLDFEWTAPLKQATRLPNGQFSQTVERYLGSRWRTDWFSCDYQCNHAFL